jgi:chemotaxis methyl-accepting protein methylase
LQQDIVKKYKMDDRVQVMCKDIQTMPELLSEEADIVIMNNVFQFFNELPIQQQIWKFVRAETKKKSGLLLVTLPSLQEQLKEAGLSASKLMKGWVKEVKLDYDGGWFQELNDDELEEIKQVHLYKVL